MVKRLCVCLLFTGFLSLAATQSALANKPLRAGIIGTDTSHVIAFTKVFNDPKAKGPLADVKVVAFYRGGSPDIRSSWSRVEKYAKQLKKMGLEPCDSIEDLLEKVDVVLVESVDGRPHLEQVKPVIKAGKPVFIDKPLAGSLADAVQIYRLAKKHNVPCFSSSSLRFGSFVDKMKNNPKIGKIVGCDAYSPCALEKHHPDFFWYGIHGVELLYAFMGPGCETVTRTGTPGTDVVVGKWKDGRIGTFRGNREARYDYGATVFGTKGVRPCGKYEGYKPLVVEIAKFFKTGKPPVSAEETLELYAFMEAAHESKRQGGKPVSIKDVLKKAEADRASK